MLRYRTCVRPFLDASLVEELERGVAGLDGTPGRRAAVLVGVALVGPQRVEGDVLDALSAQVKVRILFERDV